MYAIGIEAHITAYHLVGDSIRPFGWPLRSGERASSPAVCDVTPSAFSRCLPLAAMLCFTASIKLMTFVEARAFGTSIRSPACFFAISS
jgi:hypothetical protein